jgi:hypothetical protein
MFDFCPEHQKNNMIFSKFATILIFNLQTIIMLLFFRQSEGDHAVAREHHILRVRVRSPARRVRTQQQRCHDLLPPHGAHAREMLPG